MSPSVYDVIVVGGGMAGLVAARDLVRARRTVLLLEARERLGGRVATVRTARGNVVELGAEFVHGRPGETLALVEEAGLTLVEVGMDHADVSSGDLAPSAPFFEHVQSVLASIPESGIEDRSLATWLAEQKLDPRVVADAISYVEGFFASYVDRIGIAGLAREQRASSEHGVASYRIREGYGALVDHLARTMQGVEFGLGARVSRVRWSAKGASIDAVGSAGPRTYRARRVIVTLPLGVLQANSVVFEPALEEKRAAASRLDPGVARRITLEFRDPTWLADRLSRGNAGAGVRFVHTPELPLKVFWTSSSEARALTCWAGGPAAAALSAESLEEKACITLGAAFACTPAAIRAQLAASHAHDWSDDPFTLGAYTYPLVGGLDASRRLATSIDKVLFFAGEATHFEGELGTVAAALATGRRAAREVAAEG